MKEMKEMECRLRAAMIAAAEQAPPGLAEGIRRRHRRHVRRVSVGSAAMALAIAVAIPALTHVSLAGGPPPAGRPSGPVTTPSATPAASPGTLLLTCSSANWGQLSANWRAESLRVGPLWFADSSQLGYVHDLGGAISNGASRPGKPRLGVMIVEVADGSTVVMKAAPASRLYFRFVAGFDAARPNNLPAGDTGFTFVSCPRGTLGPNGHVTDFYLGFVIKAGRSALADIWTPSSSRASRVVFTCPGRGCEG